VLFDVLLNMKHLLIATFLILAVPQVRATSIAPSPEPKISLEGALELAKAYIRDKKIDVSHHYIDRIWIGYQEGQPERRWIISWSPKPEEVKETKGWLILTVKLDGTVTDDKGAVPWIDSRMLESTNIESPSVVKPPQTK
jgi:hypothetical protein